MRVAGDEPGGLRPRVLSPYDTFHATFDNAQHPEAQTARPLHIAPSARHPKAPTDLNRSVRARVLPLRRSIMTQVNTGPREREGQRLEQAHERAGALGTPAAAGALAAGGADEVKEAERWCAASSRSVGD